MTDASGYFQYPTAGLPGADGPAPPPDAPDVVFLHEADEYEWGALLAFSQTQHAGPGDVLFAEGEHDRALYLLTAGRVQLSVAGEPAGEIDAIAPLNLFAFLDRGLVAVTATALDECEILRLSFDAFESLAAREPVLARRILLDVGAIVARTARSV